MLSESLCARARSAPELGVAPPELDVPVGDTYPSLKLEFGV